MKPIFTLLKGAILLSPVILFFACRNYYKATNLPVQDNSTSYQNIDSLAKINRYFILRNGPDAYHLKVGELSTDRKFLICYLDTLPPNHQLHVNGEGYGKKRYKRYKSEDFNVLNEVHLYTPFDPQIKMDNYALSLDKIQKVEVLSRDKNRTTTSYVLGGLGIAAGTATVVTLIAIALKSSCPFVSAYDGTQFTLQGEIFGGAIYPQLEKDDYLPLNMSPTSDGKLELKISNELKELQFTDLAELLVVDHDNGSRLFVDQSGRLFSSSSPVHPSTAFLNGREVLEELKYADNNTVVMKDTSHKDGLNAIHLKFKKPVGKTSGRLLFKLRNTYWLDLLFGQMSRGFGSSYASFVQQQKNKSAEGLNKWTSDQRIPLAVEVKEETTSNSKSNTGAKTGSGWKPSGSVNLVGPLAMRELAMEVDFSDSQQEYVEIKLSAGFFFWEIDQVFMEFSGETNLQVHTLLPDMVIDETGKNVTETLTRVDKRYLEQPLIGNVATLSYTAPPADPSKKRSYILHARGYYEHIRNYEGAADYKFLQQFAKPGGFPQFGFDLYKSFQGSDNMVTYSNSSIEQ